MTVQTIELTEAERTLLVGLVQAAQLAQQRANDVATGILVAKGITEAVEVKFEPGLRHLLVTPVTREAPVA